MDRKEVKSSQFVSVGYDPEKEILELEFKGGAVYQYFNVSPEKFNAFIAADSPGRHFGQHIRGKFPFSKLPPPPKPAEEARVQ
jgi:hypothetical protein